VYSLKNSDIFCLADFPHRTVVMDALKSLPDDENKDITVWSVPHLKCYRVFVAVSKDIMVFH